MSSDSDLTRAMADLHSSGVRHFVVNDDLYGRLERIVFNQNAMCGHTAECPGGLYFRGYRVLRQSDLMGLPIRLSTFQPDEVGARGH